MEKKMNYTFKNNDVNILDLPDEVLIMIFSKLRMIETLYSLLNVNQRFDRLMLAPIYVRLLDLTIPLCTNKYRLTRKT